METDLITRPFEDDSDKSLTYRPKNMEIATSRQAQEVQASMAVAKHFPRNENQALIKINTACSRMGLAARAEYAYPKGGQTVQGPSIRLAETLAACWGNVDYGWMVLDNQPTESTCMAYCIDLETNTRNTRIFTVSHKRTTTDKRSREQTHTLLTDPREIYELQANHAARRVRQCIFAIIPGDILEAAVLKCRETVKKGHGDVPLADRVRKLILAFHELGVSEEMIRERVGHKLDTMVEAEFEALRKIFVSIRDEASVREDWFNLHAGEEASQPEKLAKSRSAAIAGQGKKAEPPAQQEPAQAPASEPKKSPPKKQEPPRQQAPTIELDDQVPPGRHEPGQVAEVQQDVEPGFEYDAYADLKSQIEQVDNPADLGRLVPLVMQASEISKEQQQSLMKAISEAGMRFKK